MVKRNSKVSVMLVAIIFICSTFGSTAFAYDKTYTTYMAGNSHIDTAWQWTTAVTRSDFIKNTYTRAASMMDANPDYSFHASGAVHLKWLKQDCTSVFNSIKSKVASGKVALVGGQWLEPDLNMSSGESLVRQVLYGQRFFQQEFGKKSTVGWVPDVFGFSGQMPQILKESGMNYFVTTKLNWNDTNRFPVNDQYAYEIFKWNGIDGSQVIVDKPRQDYTSSATDTNNNIYTLDEPNRHGIKKGLALYGSGDRGGGPTQSDIDSIRAQDAVSTNPNIKMYTAEKFFNDLTPTDKANITDTWTGEMYLENHRGTYTTQALIKKNNRLGEIAAEEAEKFSSMAQWAGAAAYNQAAINGAWEKIMVNQFHDILPGSGSADQVAEAQANGTAAITTLSDVSNKAIAGIASKADTTVASGVPVVVFNPLSFGRRQPVETNVVFSTTPASIKVFDGATEIPSQILSINGTTARIVFMLDNIPAMGYKVVSVVPNTGNYTGSTGLSIGSNVITSDLFQVTINGTTGNISSIVDKANGNKQVFAGGEGNVLQILEDTPSNWDAWNVDYDDMTAAPLATLNTTSGISIVENGPVKCTYRVNKSYGGSTFSQYITLYPTINRIDIRMTADWHETHKMLKVAFPFNVSGATSANYEVAYGTQNRSNQRDTSFNKARFEVSAHKWADLSNGGYGVSLLNNCKYGYDTYLNTMRLSLLRSPNMPTWSSISSGAVADMGAHEFTYSLYPHSGDWKTANTVYKGYELNYPMIAHQTTSHPGTLGSSYSFMSVSQPNVILSVVKKAEDTSDFIIRAYETQGIGGTNATITVPGTISSISETNLLEENTGTPSYSGNAFSTTFGPYDIKTFKVNFGGTTPPASAAVTNVALNKTATASGYITGEEPSKAVNGSTTGGNSDKWCSNAAGDKWLKVDLGSNYDISRWVVKSAGTGLENTGWNTKDYKLQKSSEGTNFTDVDSVIGNILDSTDREVTPFTARYVRLYITNAGADATARIYEFETYGVPTVGTNIALGKTATASAQLAGEEAAKAVDGTVTGNSKWCTNAAGDSWLKLDLGANYDISRWVVKHASAGGETAFMWNTKDFKLQKSADGTNWTDVDAVTGNIAGVTDRAIPTINTRYVRLYVTAPTSSLNVATRIYEFELY